RRSAPGAPIAVASPPPMTTPRTARIVSGVLIAASAIAFAASVSEAWLYARNTLRNNGRWDSTKMALERGVMGAGSYFITRPALSRNDLHLGAWHGFQEVVLKEPLGPARVSVTFSLDEDAYCIFLFRKDERGFEGIRMSAAAAFPSAYLRGSPDGHFTSRR